MHIKDGDINKASSFINKSKDNLKRLILNLENKVSKEIYR